jgi:hypothetical protein
MLDYILRPLIRDVLEEYVDLGNMAEDLATQILCKGLLESRPLKSTYQQMVDVLYHLEDQRHQEVQEGKAGLHFPVMTLEEFKAAKEAQQGKKPSKQPQQPRGDEADNDREATRIDPTIECMTVLATDWLPALETDYWNSYKLLFKGYEGKCERRSYWVGPQSTNPGVTALTITSNGRFVALAVKRDWHILVYDTVVSPPR